MFSDQTFSPVSARSDWETFKDAAETGTQTADEVKVDKELQTSSKDEKQVQVHLTEDKEAKNVEVDEEALAAFLHRVCPKVLDELDKNSRSKAFLSYTTPEEDDMLDAAKHVHTLMKPKYQINELKIYTLAWSCTGSVVAFGLGFQNHEHWCSHPGFINFYNINGNTTTVMTPYKTLETTSCVTVLATHPYEPFILASGLFRGNIVLWNLQEDDAECIITVDGHNDSITQLSWISNQMSQPLLVSSGLDGQMSVWHSSHLSETLSLKERYMLGNIANASLEAGVACFSFSPRRSHIFVVALEAEKRVLHCSMIDTPSRRVNTDVVLKNPVIGEFTGYDSLVVKLAFSPYHDDIFLSLSFHKTIHVNSLKEAAPLKVICCEKTVAGLAWSPSQANIFLSWGMTNEISVYDCKKGHKVSSLKTDQMRAIWRLAFNWKSPKLLAVGGFDGKGHVLQIPQRFETG